MYNLFDTSLTIDLGEVSDREEAVMVLFEEGMNAGVMCGYRSGEYFEERVEVFCKEGRV